MKRSLVYTECANQDQESWNTVTVRLCRMCKIVVIPKKRSGRGRQVELCEKCKRINARAINNRWYAKHKKTQKYRDNRIKYKNTAMEDGRKLVKYVDKIATYVEEHEAAVEDLMRYE